MTPELRERHYEKIAEIIRYMDMLDYNSKAFVAYRFANKLRATNQAFNREKFLRACGVIP